MAASPIVIIENLELAEKRDLHGVDSTGGGQRALLAEPVSGTDAQLHRRSGASTLSRPCVLDGLGDQVDDVVVLPEAGEVFEREVDRADYHAGAAQVMQFVEFRWRDMH